ncbi:MAG TPA: hypothetical protein P5050_12295 [Bacteroidia bacterium]|nr:hypothetical protein [Bacteroidia bacterium]
MKKTKIKKDMKMQGLGQRFTIYLPENRTDLSCLQSLLGHSGS